MGLQQSHSSWHFENPVEMLHDSLKKNNLQVFQEILYQQSPSFLLQFFPKTLDKNIVNLIISFRGSEKFDLDEIFKNETALIR